VRPATIRRLLVFGVCAAGIGALYLMPSVAGTSGQSGSRSSGGPQLDSRPVGYVTQRSAEQTTRGTSDQTVAAAPGGSAAPEVSTSGPGRPSERQRDAAAPHPADAPDREAPSTVTDLTFPTVSPSRLTVRWAPASDNVGVTSYRIWLNGYRIAETTELQVTVPWFNDGSRQQVVEVRAVDAAGNQSEDAPARLVERPAASPNPTPSVAVPSPSSRTTATVAPESEPPTDDPNK
jgi:hypothetical protein